MEVCFKCGKRADYICPQCGTKACRTHMELRYVGPFRGFKSRYMCPTCWKSKRRVLNEQMIGEREYEAKTYVYGK